MIHSMQELGEIVKPGYRWEKRRISILRISPRIFGRLILQSACYEVTSGLPSDAVCMAFNLDIHTGDLLLLIESEEFEPVELGVMAPELDAMAIVIEAIEGESDDGE